MWFNSGGKQTDVFRVAQVTSQGGVIESCNTQRIIIVKVGLQVLISGRFAVAVEIAVHVRIKLVISGIAILREYFPDRLTLGIIAYNKLSVGKSFVILPSTTLSAPATSLS